MITGLDLVIRLHKKITCPDCGKFIDYAQYLEIGKGGREWKPMLAELGYGNSCYAKRVYYESKEDKQVIYDAFIENEGICNTYIVVGDALKLDSPHSEDALAILEAVNNEDKAISICADW